MHRENMELQRLFISKFLRDYVDIFIQRFIFRGGQIGSYQFFQKMLFKELIFDDFKLEGLSIDLKVVDEFLGMFFQVFVLYLVHIGYFNLLSCLEFLKHSEQKVIFCD